MDSERTRAFGLNFRASSFGVGSVWMNIVRRGTVAAAEGVALRLWFHDCILGLCCALEATMGDDDCWWRHLVVMRGRGPPARREDPARERLRRAERDMFDEDTIDSLDGGCE